MTVITDETPSIRRHPTVRHRWRVSSTHFSSIPHKPAAESFPHSPLTIRHGLLLPPQYRSSSEAVCRTLPL